MTPYQTREHVRNIVFPAQDYATTNVPVETIVRAFYTRENGQKALQEISKAQSSKEPLID